MSDPTASPSSARAPWVALLAGPVLGMAYFWLVYLSAEGACTEAGPDPQPAVVRLIALVAAVATIMATAAVFLWARRWGGAPEPTGAPAAEERRFVGSTATVLLALFTVFVLMVMAPVLATGLC